MFSLFLTSVFAFLLSGFIFLKFLFLASSFECFVRILYYFRLLKLSKYLFKNFELMKSVLKITMIRVSIVGSWDIKEISF